MWPVIVSAAVAAISALVSIFLAVFNARRTQEAQAAIETLKNQFARERSREDARIEYEYQARQRLYEQFEPLRFRLLEAVETAKCQIETMSEQALERDLERLGRTPTGNYWILGTIYHLLHPAAVFRIAQRRLTLVDLRIDKTLHVEYVLAKSAYLTLSHDARMADIAPMAYTPYVDGWPEKREVNPAQFRRQGLPLGRLDNAVGVLISDDERILTFGEFEGRSRMVEPGDVSGPVGAVRDLFTGFSPLNRPILWRLLLAQFIIYKALLASIQRSESPLNVLVAPWQNVGREERVSLGLSLDIDAPLPSEFIDAAKYLKAHVVPDVRAIVT